MDQIKFPTGLITQEQEKNFFIAEKLMLELKNFCKANGMACYLAFSVDHIRREGVEPTATIRAGVSGEKDDILDLLNEVLKKNPGFKESFMLGLLAGF